jgi:serine/threonine protein kinase
LQEEVALADKPFAEGGFGSIYMCKWRGKEAVAKELKNLGGNGGGSSGFAEFQKEASVMSRLSHPNIVQLFGVTLSPLRMILELCKLGDLFSLIGKKQLQGSVELQSRISLDIAKGMRFLHEQNPPLAHRDLRSPNVLICSLDFSSEKPLAKIADFGLAVFQTEKMRDPLGAWQWMSPEAQMGSDYSEKCDLYSFGIVVWEIFSGEFPFREFAATKEMQLFRGIREENLRPTIPSSVPKYVSTVIRRCWQTDSQKRPDFAFVQTCFETKTAQKPAVQLDINFDHRPKMFARICRQILADVRLEAPLCMAPAAEHLAIGFRGGDVAIFDLHSCEMIRRESRAHREHVYCVVKVPHFAEIWTGARDGMVGRWATESNSANHSTLSSSTAAAGMSEESEDHGSTRGGLRASKFVSRKQSSSPGASPSNRSGKLTPLVLPPESGVKSEVTVLVPFCNLVAVGDSSGRLFLMDPGNATCVAWLQLPGKGRQPVTAAAAGVYFEHHLWLGAGPDLYRITFGSFVYSFFFSDFYFSLENKQLSAECLCARAHERFVAGLVCSGKEVWSLGGNPGAPLRIWDGKSARSLASVVLPRPSLRSHCIALVNLRGEPKVWIGCDDEIHVYDVKRRAAQQVLSSPIEGEVMCLAQTGINAVWAGVRQKDDSGALVYWNLN